MGRKKKEYVENYGYMHGNVWNAETSLPCENLDKQKISIVIPIETYIKIRSLFEDKVIGSREFIVYLEHDGYDEEKREFRVVDIFFPKQEVGHASVKPSESPIGNYGVLHSHVDMAAYFSGVDDDYLNANNDFSIVMNKKGEYQIGVKVNLPCGRTKFMDDIGVLKVDNGEISFAKECRRKIKTLTTGQQYPIVSFPGAPNYYRRNDKDDWARGRSRCGGRWWND